MIFTLILYIYYTHQTHHPYVYIHHQYLASVQGHLPVMGELIVRLEGLRLINTYTPHTVTYLQISFPAESSCITLIYSNLPVNHTVSKIWVRSKSHTNTINTWYISTQTHKSYMVYTYKHNNTSILGFWVHIYFQHVVLIKSQRGNTCVCFIF